MIWKKIIEKQVLSIEEADKVYEDLVHLTTTGVWPNSVAPEWAVEMSRHYQVLEAHSAVQNEGWKAVAKAYRSAATGK